MEYGISSPGEKLIHSHKHGETTTNKLPNSKGCRMCRIGPYEIKFYLYLVQMVHFILLKKLQKNKVQSFAAIGRFDTMAKFCNFIFYFVLINIKCII